MKIVKTQDFSSTMNLPKKTIPVDGDLVKRQGYFLNKIQNDNKYVGAIRKNVTEGKRLRFANFPVDAKEALDSTVIFNQILKDIYIRHEVLYGNIVSDNITFVDHGIEIKNNEKKDINNKDLSENLRAKHQNSIKVNNELRKQVEKINTLGTALNYNKNFNSTAEPGIEALVIDKFLELYKEQKIYRSFRPIYWCPNCLDTKEKNDILYKEENIDNYYILYNVKSDDDKIFKDVQNLKDIYFIANTISPWIMVSSNNIALAENVEYSLVQVKAGDKNIYYIIDSDKVEEFMAYKFYIKYVVIKNYKADDFKNVKCYNPLNYNKNINIIHAKKEYIYVDDKNTSGIRIVSGGDSYIDYIIFRDLKINNIRATLDNKGYTTNNVVAFNNMHYSDVNKNVIDFLSNNGFIYEKSNIKTSIKYCKKCNTKIIYATKSDWYLRKTSNITEEQYNNIKSRMCATKKYKEEELRNQINKINQEKEVVISNKGNMGIPIPVFYCGTCGSEIVEEKINKIVQSIFREKGSEYWYKSTPEQILRGQVGCKKCGGTFLFKDNDSLTEFFKELSIPFVFKTAKPVDYVCIESKDKMYDRLRQVSFLDKIEDTFYKINKNMIHTSVDENMKKSNNISKETKKQEKTSFWNKKSNSKKISHDVDIAKDGDIKSNDAINKVIENYGTDILRVWVISKCNNDRINLNDQYIKNTKKKYMGIRRTFKFLLSNLTDFNPSRNYIEVENRDEHDKLYYSKLYTMNKEVENDYEELSLKGVYKALTSFCSNELCTEYFETIKYKLYVLRADDKLRRSVQSTLYDILMCLCIHFEPIIPFTLEEIWTYIWHATDDEKNNILLLRNKKLKEISIDEEVVKKWDRIYKFKNKVKVYLAKAKVSRVINEKMEATLDVTTKDEASKKFIDDNKENIRSTLGISNIICNLGEEDIIKAVKSEGTECRRCRQYSQFIGRNLKYTYLCPKCADILESEENT